MRKKNLADPLQALGVLLRAPHIDVGAARDLLGGARHALWDRGLYMDAKGRELLAQATLVGGIALTALTWILSTLAG